MRTLLLLATSMIAAAASVDGIQIHSTTHGKGPKTLIFVHGWTCDETSWVAQVSAFEKDYRVVTMDLPGHGKSGSPTQTPLSMDLFARAIEAVRAEVGAEKIVLVGHSMGVPVIRQYARLYGSYLVGLVPVDGVLKLTGNGPNPEFMKGPEGRKNRESMIKGMFGPGATPAIQSAVLNMMLRAPEATAYQAMSATFAPANWKDETFVIPALGIFADKSTAHDAKYFKQVFPNGTSTEVAGTGHFVMLEKPTEFNRLLTNFLKTVKF
jgi:sigma-B regulation protein RsbQ